MSETNNPELKTTTKLYTLSLEDFLPEKAPQQPKPYHPGDKITRENFVSLLIYSFAISRGQLAKQVAFFNWVQMNSGFEAYPIWGELVRNNKDMSEDIREYFSPAERDMFMNAFGKVANMIDIKTVNLIKKVRSAVVCRQCEVILKLIHSSLSSNFMWRHINRLLSFERT